MATGTAGTSAVNYGRTMVHFLRKEISFGSTGASTGLSMGTIPSGAVISDVVVNIETAFDAGTTNVLTVGNSSDDDAYLAAGDVTETATGLTRYSGKGVVLSADTELLVQFVETGTAATAGKAQVIVEFIPDVDG